MIYRPPNDRYNDYENKLKAMLSKITAEHKECYIMGDFNIDLLKYGNCDSSNRFVNQMFSSSLIPTIKKPTRITNTTATLIDNIFTNTENNIQTNGILFNDISDHLPIFLIETQSITNNKYIKTKKVRMIN